MDAFENVVEEILRHDGYWVRQSVKVNLTLQEKRKIGRPTCPRWEIDIVAYKGKTNELLLVECKSYLDSLGVTLSAFGERASKNDRFKLFNDAVLFSVVSERLISQLEAEGAVNRLDIKPKLCLAAGHIRKKDREQLGKYFAEKEWKLLDEDWLKEHLNAMSASPYENSVTFVTAKLLRGDKT